MRCAMLGDMIAEAGTKNGWSGIVIYGCIRDSKMIGGTSYSTPRYYLQQYQLQYL
jgi:regulator of RNase E activity RraA